MSQPLEECDDNVERFMTGAFEDFESEVDALKEKGDAKALAAAWKCFEEKVIAAAKAGFREYRHYELLAKTCTVPRARLGYFAQAYELLVEEHKTWPYTELPCILQPYYDKADYLHEIAHIHEAQGDMKSAAHFYRRALQHLHEGADACDAVMNYDQPNVVRRTLWNDSLARVEKFMEKT